MTRQEFDERCKAHKQITNEDYKIIEYVYTHHPAIDDIDGKNQIAMLVDTFGMRIICDMLPTARKASELFTQMQNARMEADRLSKELTKLSRAEDIKL